MTEKKTFPRSISGLPRGIGPVTAVLITMAYTVGAAWQRLVFISIGQTPLPENMWLAGIPPSVMAFAIGGIIVLLIMLGYSVLISAMPRSGGGYVAISRILGPFPAFIGSWLELFSIASTTGGIAAFVFEYLFLTVGPSLGYLPPPTSYNDVGFFVGGLFLIILTTAIVALGVRITGYVLQFLVWIPAVLSVYVLYLLGSAIINPAILQNGISAWAQAHGVSGTTADTYVNTALAQGLDAASVGNYWTAVSGTLLFAYFAYVGYAALTFVAGEVKNPEKNLPRVLLIAPAIIVIMYVTMTAFAAYAAAGVGQITLPNGDKWSFLEAYSYLSYGAGNLHANPTLPNFTSTIPLLASMIGTGLGLGSLNILLVLFAVLWLFNDLPALFLVGSRLIFAMSFDRLLPNSLSEVDSRFHSPLYATILAGIFGLLGVLGETCVVCNGNSWGIGGTLGDILTGIFSNGIFALDLLDVVFFSLFALAVVMFPLRSKRTFDATPFKPGGRLGVITIGLAGLIANIIIGWVVLTSPRDSYNILSPTPDNLYALAFDILLGLIGCLIYAYYRYGPRRKEIDYATIFSEIPPE